MTVGLSLCLLLLLLPLLVVAEELWGASMHPRAWARLGLGVDNPDPGSAAEHANAPRREGSDTSPLHGNCPTYTFGRATPRLTPRGTLCGPQGVKVGVCEGPTTMSGFYSYSLRFGLERRAIWNLCGPTDRKGQVETGEFTHRRLIQQNVGQRNHVCDLH